MAQQPAPFSISEALRFGWERTKGNLKPLLTLGLIVFFLGVLRRLLLVRGSETGLRWLMVLAVELVQFGVSLAYIRTAIRIHDGKPVDLSRPADQLADFFPYLLTSIVYSIVLAIGLVLLFVPGVFWALTFGFATLLVVDKRLDTLAAFQESRRLTRGVKGPLFGFGLAMIGVNLIGLIALGVGMLFTIPVSLIAGVHVLRTLQARAGVRVEEPHAPPILPREPVNQP